jgi:hypothetical protein
MRLTRVRFTGRWMMVTVVALSPCIIAGASVRFESWEYREGGATTIRYAALLPPWQRAPMAPSGTMLVVIRKRSLLGLHRFDYMGPPGLFPGTGGHD